MTYMFNLVQHYFQMYSKNAKANKKYMRNYDKNRESSFLIYDDANNGWSMYKKLPVGDFEWVDD